MGERVWFSSLLCFHPAKGEWSFRSSVKVKDLLLQFLADSAGYALTSRKSILQSSLLTQEESQITKPKKDDEESTVTILNAASYSHPHACTHYHL